MKFSLSRKAIVLIVSIALVISIIAVVVYNIGIRDVVKTQYSERVLEISKLVAESVDKECVTKVRDAVVEIYKKADNKVLSDKMETPEFQEYVAQFASVTEMEEYKKLLSELRKLQEKVDVDCLYITWLDVENELLVYLVDAGTEFACPVGTIDPIYMDDPEVLRDLNVGLPPNITNTVEYGWLIAADMPIYNGNNEVIAFSAVDMSMNDIMAKQSRYILYSVLIFLALTVIVSFISILVVSRFIVRPINKLSQAASQYKNNKHVFSELKMSGSDEISILSESMAQMEADINGYISNLEQTTNDLIQAREQAEMMNKAANIDALTKVRNKRSFDTDFKRLNDSSEPYGVAMIDMNGLKEINDSYGHEKGDVSIITICRHICSVFKHSPVYRVGGDEFIVILENTDYEERYALIDELRDAFEQNKNNDELQPWERVTAAIGYAEYNPQVDVIVESVLQRADAMMYENKKAMKSAM